jgi:hypothetical protein
VSGAFGTFLPEVCQCPKKPFNFSARR